MSDLLIRAALPAEAGVIVAHRRAMFDEIHQRGRETLDEMDAAFGPWVSAHLERGDYLGWFAVTAAGEVVGGAGVWVMDWPPLPGHPGNRRANVLNVYVQPEFRRRGLARRLTQTAIDWCRQAGLGVVILHASAAGRPVYEALGFTPTNEMRLVLDD